MSSNGGNGRTGQTAINIEKIRGGDNPLPPSLLSLASSGRWARLHTLRFRYQMPWVTERFLVALAPHCSQLQHLQLRQRIGHAALSRLFLPNLITLDVTHRPDDFPMALPFDKSPKLRRLCLRDFIYHYTHDVEEVPLWHGAMPASLRTLRLSIPDGALLRLALQAPDLEHLYIDGRKTHYMTHYLCGVSGLPNLQTLLIVMMPYGADEFDFKNLYAGLLGCLSFRYLRIDFKGVGGQTFTSPPPSLPAVLQLPELWFLEVPHEVPRSAGWIASTQSLAEDQVRLVRPRSEFYDEAHMRQLARSADAHLPELDFDEHPETA